MIRIEIGDTNTPNAVSNLLFEIVFFGGLLHFSSGRSFCWNHLPTFRLAVEMQNWRHHTQRASVRLCELLPARVCDLGPGTFVTSTRELSLGMGPVLGREMSDQICIVCKLLKHLNAVSAKSTPVFPGNFWKTARSLPIVPDREAFGILHTAFVNNPGESLSGHRIWSLVRILHWQLSLAFHERSTLMEVCEYLERFFLCRTIQFLVLTASDLCQPAIATENVGTTRQL